MDALNPLEAFTALQEFLYTGGPVLLWIMGLTFILWSLIIERFWFFAARFGALEKRAIKFWTARSDHKSWNAHAIREKTISEVRIETERSLQLIKTLIAIAPLLGLLGTVTGMIEVFNVMAVTGSGNARAMAAGVSKATIPTMAGLVVSLSGVFMISILDRRSKHGVNRVADELSIS